MDYPLTGDDLRKIADAVDAVERTTLAENPLIGRIEVFRPDGGEPVGWIQRRFDEIDASMGWGLMIDDDQD